MNHLSVGNKCYNKYLRKATMQLHNIKKLEEYIVEQEEEA